MPEVSFAKGKNGDTIVMRGGRALCSTYHPTLEAQRWATQWETLFQNSAHVVVLGLGAGYHVVEIASRLRGDQILTVIELSSELRTTCPRYPDQVKIVGSDWSPRHVDHEDVVFIGFRPAWAGFEEEYSALMRQFVGPSIKEKVILLRGSEKKTSGLSREAKLLLALHEVVA